MLSAPLAPRGGREREHAWILLRHQEKHFAYFSFLFFFSLNFLPQKDSSLSEQEFPFKVAGDGSMLLQDFTELILRQKQMLGAFARYYKQEQLALRN